MFKLPQILKLATAVIITIAFTSNLYTQGASANNINTISQSIGSTDVGAYRV